MSIYRIVLDVRNTRGRIPARRVRLDITAESPTAAIATINTVWTSRDGSEVNTSGVRFGYAYPEWSVVSKRKVGAAVAE